MFQDSVFTVSKPDTYARFTPDVARAKASSSPAASPSRARLTMNPDRSAWYFRIRQS